MSERDEIAAVLLMASEPERALMTRPAADERVAHFYGYLADAILASDWLAERDRRVKAEALRAMGKRFRTEARETWGADVLWTTTGSKVATLAASWCDNEADRVEQP